MDMFVTGATGKIGSRFVRRMLQRGHKVKALVRDTGRAEGLRMLGVEMIAGDLTGGGSLEEALAGSDAVIHLAAAFRGVGEAEARRSNVDATERLAEAAIRTKVPRFVFASTNLVYGAGHPDRPSREEDEPKPGNLYPQTKALAEQALLKLHRKRGLGVRILRFAFVYGDGDPHLSEFKPLMCKWHPAKRLHMVHHEDVSRALLAAAVQTGIDGTIVNIADEEPMPVAELYRLHGWPLPDTAKEPYRPWEMVADTTRMREQLRHELVYPSFRHARDAGAL